MLGFKTITPLSDFNRNSHEAIERLKASGQPELLTVNGEAAIVVQDAVAYQEMQRKIEYAETVQAIRAGMADHERGEGVPLREALEELAQEHDFSLRS